MKLDCQGIFIGIYILFFADLIYVTMRYIYCDVKQEMKKRHGEINHLSDYRKLEGKNGFTMLHKVSYTSRL